MPYSKPSRIDSAIEEAKKRLYKGAADTVSYAAKKASEMIVEPPDEDESFSDRVERAAAVARRYIPSMQEDEGTDVAQDSDVSRFDAGRTRHMMGELASTLALPAAIGVLPAPVEAASAILPSSGPTKKELEASEKVVKGLAPGMYGAAADKRDALREALSAVDDYTKDVEVANKDMDEYSESINDLYEEAKALSSGEKSGPAMREATRLRSESMQLSDKADKAREALSIAKAKAARIARESDDLLQKTGDREAATKMVEDAKAEIRYYEKAASRLESEAQGMFDQAKLLERTGSGAKVGARYENAQYQQHLKDAVDEMNKPRPRTRLSDATKKIDEAGTFGTYGESVEGEALLDKMTQKAKVTPESWISRNMDESREGFRRARQFGDEAASALSRAVQAVPGAEKALSTAKSAIKTGLDAGTTLASPFASGAGLMAGTMLTAPYLAVKELERSDDFGEQLRTLAYLQPNRDGTFGRPLNVDDISREAVERLKEDPTTVASLYADGILSTNLVRALGR